MITTILEYKRGVWWRWFIRDGEPYACVRCEPPSSWGGGDR